MSSRVGRRATRSNAGLCLGEVLAARICSTGYKNASAGNGFDISNKVVRHDQTQRSARSSRSSARISLFQIIAALGAVFTLRPGRRFKFDFEKICHDGPYPTNAWPCPDQEHEAATFAAGADCQKFGEGLTTWLRAAWLAPGFPLPPNTYCALLRRVAEAVAGDPLAVRIVVRNPGHSRRARILLSGARRAPCYRCNRCDAHHKTGEHQGNITHVHVPSGGCDDQIHTSFAVVRSPPSCPVLSTPFGSMRRSLTSCSA